jgi:hypothetical protein
MPHPYDSQASLMHLFGRTLSLTIALLLTGCASAPAPAPAPTAPEAPVDPLAKFEGTRKAANSSFRLMLAPVGVEGVGVVVRVVKAEWSEMDGERAATAVIRVERGEESKTLYLEEGDTKSALGAKIHLISAGETYDKDTMRYPPYADVIVSAG